MRKILTILFAFVLIFSLFGCTDDDRISVGDSMDEIKERYEKVYSESGLACFRTENGYAVLSHDIKKVLGLVEFSEDRVPLRTSKIKLKEIDDISVFLGKTIEEIEQEYGKLHFYYGTGFEQWGYITEKGCLVILIIIPHTYNGEKITDIVTMVSKWIFLPLNSSKPLVLASNTSKTGNLTKQTYGNGDAVSFTYVWNRAKA